MDMQKWSRQDDQALNLCECLATMDDRTLELCGMVMTILESKDKHARQQLDDMMAAWDAGRIRLMDQKPTLQRIIGSLPH